MGVIGARKDLANITKLLKIRKACFDNEDVLKLIDWKLKLICDIGLVCFPVHLVLSYFVYRKASYAQQRIGSQVDFSIYSLGEKFHNV